MRPFPPSSASKSEIADDKAALAGISAGRTDFMTDSPEPPLRQSKGALTGIAFKIASVLIFLVMSALLKASQGIPAAELVFFRSFFGILPVVVFIASQGELRTALKSHSVVSQIWRGLVIGLRIPDKEGTSPMCAAVFHLAKDCDHGLSGGLDVPKKKPGA